MVVGCCMLGDVCFRVKNLSSVGCVCVVDRGRLSRGMVHGAGKAMLMRGGTCAAELRLMGLRVNFNRVGACLI